MSDIPPGTILDTLASLHQKGSATDKLRVIHNEILRHMSFVDRIATAIYEPERDLIKTFIHSSDGDSALTFYQSTLAESRSLTEIANSRQPRVINDLDIFRDVGKHHSKRIAERGYGSSYTTPFFNNGQLAGFIFINSYDKHVFTETSCELLSPFVHLIGLMVSKEMDQIAILFGSVTSALDISHHRDPETGAHLKRMSRYSRLIAKRMGPDHGIDDEFIEYLFRFAPLHDVGKIAIPDRILLKPERLTGDEFELMKQHTSAGREIMQRMLDNFKLQEMPFINMLHNIVELHHEAIDGSGYPHGLKGDAIPLEARIIAVADIFDALTSERPYKKAWSNEEAFAELHRLAVAGKIDGNCVDAMERCIEDITAIQHKFEDDPLG
ncbi:MAG: HD domain-containing protein [Chromatiales bacterium]|nr:HD domain-containing protein [Chromatiales bacterium]